MPKAGPLRASPRRDNRPSKIVTKSPSNNVTALNVTRGACKLRLEKVHPLACY
jgi:hypothetical protein